MTIRKYIPSVYIHPILIIFIIIAFITGTFVDLFLILSIVFLHELGHFFAAKYYNWRVNLIILWIFGGVMETDEHGHHKVSEELFVILAGPLQHVFIFILIYFLNMYQLIPGHLFHLSLYYNVLILLLNLLPIWPLDGGKLLFLFFTKIFPYRRAYHSIIIFSIVMAVILLILLIFYFPFTLSAYLLVFFLILENMTEWKQRYYVFLRYLLKRYSEKIYVEKETLLLVPPHLTLMEVFYLFKRNERYQIYVKGLRAIPERDCLRTYFDNKRYHLKISEIATL